MTKINWMGAALLAAILIPLLPLSTYAQGRSEDPAQRDNLVQRVEELEKIVHELEEANSLLMENLANCTEDNESLSAQLESEKGGAAVLSSEVQNLILRIRAALVTGETMSFLKKLNRGDLEKLLRIIQKRLER